MPEQSILDARLAEIDRRLSLIQSGLAPSVERWAGEEPQDSVETETETETEPPPAAVPPDPDAGRAAEAQAIIARLQELTAAHERLLACSRELLAAFASSPAGAQPRPGPPPEISVAAGPFANTAALRRFERALVALPEVREVAIREYAGEDRVVVDVHLFAPTS